jgi:anthranilate synthase/aminodeoxychorismate synthase-like glutamine amidotransferase
MIVLLDNYDSFTYNLAQYLEEAGAKVSVVRNDRISTDEVLALRPAGILISPGPCVPEMAGISIDLILRAAASVPIFGVCLGMQAIGRAFGSKLVRADRIMHGKTSAITHDGRGIFADLPNPMQAIRYHSLVLRDLPDELHETAHSDDGEIMAIHHESLPLEGVQFHPESILTESGKQMIGNWLRSLS